MHLNEMEFSSCFHLTLNFLSVGNLMLKCCHSKRRHSQWLLYSSYAIMPYILWYNIHRWGNSSIISCAGVYFASDFSSPQCKAVSFAKQKMNSILPENLNWNSSLKNSGCWMSSFQLTDIQSVFAIRKGIYIVAVEE